MNFDGFSPDSFEQFIRALGLKVFGPGVTVFGNGPDGGREAIFKGLVPYPYPPSENWNGYGVLQAKFKEKIEGNKVDTAWAKGQLESELKRWKESKKRNPKPDYYIFCTNVELSSAKNGGKEILENILENSKTTLGIKGYAIWDANQLKTFIDANSEIRQRFNCFFTPGDLLEKFSRLLAKVPNPDSILTAFLCRELSADEDAKLSQAGDRSEDRIRLAKVFVDLPSSSNLNTETHEDDEDGPASLHQLLRVSTNRLDPLALYEQRGAPASDGPTQQKLYGRFLFLGGPGSGKSTIGQFLAQVHRAALLSRRPAHRLETKIREIIEEVRLRCTEDRLTWPATPRFPFRIDLNSFAKALSREANGVVSLSDYIRRMISPDLSISHEDLRDWLRLFPILLILDGLDEVPTSSNRREVIESIRSFLNEARDVETDLMIVSSSRPDGYSGEFDGEELSHRYLLPMSRARALACASRYVNSKINILGEQRGQEAMTILTAAIDNPLIEKLMRSPLQVTFMVTVVAASGKPSDSRWQLFNDYYRIIYERELHKAVRPFSQVLNSRRQDIDSLHHTVGFILQCRAELSGGTEADLSKTEFDYLVYTCLQENGLEQDELEKQKQMIVGAANSRLVFITSRKPGRLSFDVRSLQEYMAAACITNIHPEQAIRTLEVIAHSAYWRNVLLFAVGRFFVEPQMRIHREKIRLLCENLNLRDDDSSKTKLGSWIALDILESGTVGDVPLITRSLANCALGLLSFANEDDDTMLRLGQVYDPPMDGVYQANIELWLGQSDERRTYSAWLLLMYLERKGIDWAQQMISKWWPEDANKSWEILKRWLVLSEDYEEIEGDTVERAVISATDTIRLRKIIFKISPSDLIGLAFPVRIDAAHPDADWLQLLFDWFVEECNDLINAQLNIGEKKWPLSFSINPLPSPGQKFLFSCLERLLEREEAHEDWELIGNFSEFFIEPSESTLKSTLSGLASIQGFPKLRSIIGRLPWVLQVCLREARNNEGLLNIHDRLLDGALGDFSSWTAIENEWTTNGVIFEELCGALGEHGLSIGPAINRAKGQLEPIDAIKVSKLLLSILSQEQDRNTRRLLSWTLAFVADRADVLAELPSHELSQHLLGEDNIWTSQSFRATSKLPAEVGSPWYDFFDKLGLDADLRFSSYIWKKSEINIDFYVNGYKADQSRIGLLRLLGFVCAAGVKVNEAASIPLNREHLSPQLLFSTLLIRLAYTNLTDAVVDSIIEDLPRAFSDNDDVKMHDVFLTALGYHSRDSAQTRRLLDAFETFVPLERLELKARIDRLRKRTVEVRPSGLGEKLLADLSLPSMAIPSSDE